jgi:hypothetical protein
MATYPVFSQEGGQRIAINPNSVTSIIEIEPKRVLVCLPDGGSANIAMSERDLMRPPDDERGHLDVIMKEAVSSNPKRLCDRAGNGRSVSSIDQRRVICPTSRARRACAERRWADHSIR